MVRDVIQETGAQAELIPVEGKGNPVVYGKLLSPGTQHPLTAYQMYDTQPVGELHSHYQCLTRETGGAYLFSRCGEKRWGKQSKLK